MEQNHAPRNTGETQKIDKFPSLSNSSLRIAFSPYGAGIRKINWKGENMPYKNIVLTLTEEEAGSKNPLYAGATLAPAAGRIENGRLSLDGVPYLLTRNEQGKHHLHGGKENLSFSPWKIVRQTDHTLIFSNFLKDGTDGYPGNREFWVTYTLKDHCLEIRQHAESDKKTYFNMSNHTYFNLNSFAYSGLNQYLSIHAGWMMLNNEDHIPQKNIRTANTAFDFLSPVNIGKRICSYPGNMQFRTAKGLNHYFLLSDRNPSSPACSLSSADGKTALRLYTDAPALVVYTGGFIDASSHYEINNGVQPAYPGCAVAIEPTYVPCSEECRYGAKEFDRFICWEFES